MNPYFAAFLVLPIALFVAKGFGKLPLPMGAIFLICVAVGWLLVNLGVQWYFASLDERIHSTDNPPQELLNEWQNDGAKQVFAVLFGWVYAAIYFLLTLPCFYASRFITQFAARVRQQRRHDMGFE